MGVSILAQHFRDIVAAFSMDREVTIEVNNWIRYVVN